MHDAKGAPHARGIQVTLRPCFCYWFCINSIQAFSSSHRKFGHCEMQVWLFWNAILLFRVTVQLRTKLVRLPQTYLSVFFPCVVLLVYIYKLSTSQAIVTSSNLKITKLFTSTQLHGHAILFVMYRQKVLHPFQVFIINW